VQVDSELRIDEVAQMFGHFVKFSAAEIGDEEAQLDETTGLVYRMVCMYFTFPIAVGNCRNAFEVLMSASRRLTLPNKILHIKNKKQQLYNDLIEHFESNNMMWYADEVADDGEKFLANMVDLLWYIDSHRDVFKHRNKKIPDNWSKFSGYNIPEASKHRKRSIQNMSAPVLREHSNNLFNCLQRKFWLRSNWQPWKADVESLATSVSDYALYLQEQNKKMKQHHLQLHPVRQVSDNMALVLLPVNEQSQDEFLTP